VALHRSQVTDAKCLQRKGYTKDPEQGAHKRVKISRRTAMSPREGLTTRARENLGKEQEGDIPGEKIPKGGIR